MSNFTAALVEERRAREAAQQRAAEVERQNLLLRLQLSSLRLQLHDRKKENEKKKAGRTAGGGVPSSPLTSEWPPHCIRESGKASMETFLARCGFVPLDSAASAESPRVSLLAMQKAASPQPQQQHNHLASSLSSPNDAHSLRSITVNPSAMQALLEGSTPWEDAARAAAAAATTDDVDDSVLSSGSSAAATEMTSTSTSSVLAVVNTASLGALSEHPLAWSPGRCATTGVNDNCRGSLHRRGRVVGAESPESSPLARSPGWGQQLVDSVRTTLETVRAMSSRESFYEEDDINASAD
jgi:hypothetical protein